MRNYKLGMIIAAGGSGSRFSTKINKLMVKYQGRELFVHSLEHFVNHVDNNNLAIAAPQELMSSMQQIAAAYLDNTRLRWTVGGPTRIASVVNAFNLLDPDLDLVAIHDAARPLADGAMLDALCRAALEYGGAIPGSAPVDTVKEIDSHGFIKRNLIRQDLQLVSTPQVFVYQEYKKALAALGSAICSGSASDPELTDDAAIFFNCGGKVKVVPFDGCNLKITLPGDINL